MLRLASAHAKLAGFLETTFWSGDAKTSIEQARRVSCRRERMRLLARDRIRPYPKSLAYRARARLRTALIDLRLWYLRRVQKMDIGRNVKISLRANLDTTNPRGVHIGDGTYIAFHAVIFTHDMSRVIHTNTYVGRNCFIGAHAIIMPGVRVGDECIVGSGSVVTKDVPPGSIVAGNPAKVVRSGIRTGQWGILVDAFEEAVAMERADLESARSET